MTLSKCIASAAGMFGALPNDAPPFDPTTYGAVIEWLTLRDTSQTGGSVVTRFVGKTNDRDFAQNTAGNQAIYLAETPPAADFDDDDVYVYSTADTAFDVLHQTGGTIFFRVRDFDATAGAGTNRTLFGTADVSTNSRGVSIRIDGRQSLPRNNMMVFVLTDGGGSIILNTSNPGHEIGSITPGNYYVLAAAWNSSGLQLYLNGAVLGPAVSPTSAFLTGTSSTTPRIGVVSGFTAMQAGYAMSDALIYSSTLSAADVAAISTELGYD